MSDDDAGLAGSWIGYHARVSPGQTTINDMASGEQTTINDMASGERLTYAELDDGSTDRRRRNDNAECHVLAAAHYSQVGQHKYLTSHIVTDTVHGE